MLLVPLRVYLTTPHILSLFFFCFFWLRTPFICITHFLTFLQGVYQTTPLIILSLFFFICFCVTTNQGAWKRWKARQVLRKKAQKIYKKHWNVRYLEYYYEDSRSRNTVWVKPLSLGSYDVDCAPGWCAMHDSEEDLYFYNPISWDMTWNQVIEEIPSLSYLTWSTPSPPPISPTPKYDPPPPPSCFFPLFSRFPPFFHQPALTTICTECGQDFAVARISNEPNNLRCEECFNKRAFELLAEGVKGTYIGMSQLPLPSI